MKIRTTILAVSAAAVFAGVGMGAVACSSDSGTGTPNGAASNDASTASDTSSRADANVDSPDTSVSPVADAGTSAPDCGHSTAVLHPVEAGTGPYCPFSRVGDGGNVTCAANEHCCETPGDAGAPSTCQAMACASTNDTDWQCQDPNNCGSGDVCCAITTGAQQDPGCSSFFLSKFKGTACRKTCASTELIVCERDSECASPETCHVVTAKGGTFGFCR